MENKYYVKRYFFFLNFELIVSKDKNYYTTCITHYIYTTVTDLLWLHD